MSKELICSVCGKKLLTFESYTRKYGSPLRQCKKCGTSYLDPRFHELAATGIPEDEFKLSPYIIMAVFGALVLWRGIYLFSLRELGVPDELQWLLPTVFTVGGAAMILGGIIEMILIKTGVRTQKLHRLYDESLERLNNKEYAQTLSRLGYPVPEKFL